MSSSRLDDVARVQAARVDRHLRRHVLRRPTPDARRCRTSSPATDPSTLPPVSAARSTTTEPGLHRLDHRAGDQQRRRPAGHGRRGDDARRRRRRTARAARAGAAPGPRPSRGRSRRSPSSASRSSSTNLAPIDRTSSAEADRTSYASTTAPSRLAVAIACSPATPGAEHQHLGRRDRAGRRHQQREERGQALGRDQRRAVPGHQRLRGQRVHRLGARDPRQQLQRERRRTGRRHGPDAVGVRARGEEAGGHAAAPQPRDLVGRRRRDVQQDVRRRPVGIGRDGRAGGRERVVRDVGVPAGAGLHDDVEAGLGQPRDAVRHRRDAPLTLARLRRHEDSHGGHGIQPSGAYVGGTARLRGHGPAAGSRRAGGRRRRRGHERRGRRRDPGLVPRPAGRRAGPGRRQRVQLAGGPARLGRGRVRLPAPAAPAARVPAPRGRAGRDRQRRRCAAAPAPAGTGVRGRRPGAARPCRGPGRDPAAGRRAGGGPQNTDRRAAAAHATTTAKARATSRRPAAASCWSCCSSRSTAATSAPGCR